MKVFPDQTIIELTIEQFSKEGNGLGHYKRPDGKIFPVEVPFTMPGDYVSVVLLRKHRGIYSSKLYEIKVPSPQRIEPKCKHFGDCGGCRWQHLPYEMQLLNKQESVYALFEPLLSAESKLKPILACDEPWYYRNKMEFSFSSDAAHNQYLGLMLDKGKGKVFNLTECHLVESWFAKAAEATRSWWATSNLEAFHVKRQTGSLRTLTLRTGLRSGDRLVMLTVSGNADYALNRQQIDTFVQTLRQAIEPEKGKGRLSLFLRIHQAIKGHPTQFFEMHLYGPDHIQEVLHVQKSLREEPLHLTFKISPTAFFQPNPRQAEKLYSAALQMVDLPSEGVVYDLYCGTGTLGICAAQSASQVFGIEISPEAVLDAKENAKLNGVSNLTLFAGSVQEHLVKMRTDKNVPLPDLVMVDPPRVGLDQESLKQLVDFKSPNILYISCNPATQAQNVAFLRAHGYQIKALQPVDQFPQTVHIENIVLLEKR